MVYEKVIKYCSEKRMSITNFEQMCKLPNGIVGKWNSKDYEPRISTVKKIVEATGIPINEWLE